MATLGEIIKARRRLNKLSLRKFSKLCDLSHTYIENLERGISTSGKNISPTIGALVRISSTLDMPLEQLLTESGFIKWKPRSINTLRIREVRNNMTYDEIYKDIYKKTNNHFLPQIYENLEKGLDLTPPSMLMDVLSEYTNKPKSYFYNDTLSQNNSGFIDTQIGDSVKSTSISQKRRYIEFAKELSDRNIDLAEVRKVLYREALI